MSKPIAGRQHPIKTRAELAVDYDSISEIHRSAFGRNAEALLVERLRDREGFDPNLSLVAFVGDLMVGHVLFAGIVIETRDDPLAALALAPLGVLPSWQKRGVGSRLVLDGLSACRERDHSLVIVLGEHSYYCRFGFTPAAAWGIQAPFRVPEEAWLAMELVSGAGRRAAGVVRYPPPFQDV